MDIEEAPREDLGPRSEYGRQAVPDADDAFGQTPFEEGNGEYTQTTTVTTFATAAAGFAQGQSSDIRLSDDAEALVANGWHDDTEEDWMVLYRAWLNERNAPELLQYMGVSIENVLEQISFQQNVIDELRQSGDPKHSYKIIILLTDLERIRYILRSYLRTRLKKIEAHTKYYLENPIYRDRMSSQELNFAKRHNKLLDSHYQASCLSALPSHLRSIGNDGEETPAGISMVSKPNLDSAVFCRVKEEIGDYQFGDELIYMSKNSIFITRYAIIRHLLEDGRVELI
ncbi:GINS complex subunit [Spiromyces aspiralis]|uniref:GINS complex subunit n=1 Tax=Spiromyces aspiralis TaxID=68401 RepID=A0ACC1HEX0_9FUNG|nr:GINS complex subunit [Spiromyces aspiralis]